MGTKPEAMSCRVPLRPGSYRGAHVLGAALAGGARGAAAVHEAGAAQAVATVA